MVKPGVSLSTRKHVIFFLMPRGVSSSPVATNTITKSAILAWLIKCLVPLTIQSSPSGRAAHCIPLTSEPAPGSVRASASNFSPDTAGNRYFSLCSPSQAINMPEGLPKNTVSAFDPRPNSRSTKVKSKWFKPAPPTSSGKLHPKKPRSLHFCAISLPSSSGTKPCLSTISS